MAGDYHRRRTGVERKMHRHVNSCDSTFRLGSLNHATVGMTRTRVVLIGICGVALVIGGLALAGAFSSSSSSFPTLPTTGDYRPISIASPVNGAVADPDSMARQGQDLTSVL